MNIDVYRSGGLGDIITVLYFCNYYHQSGHKVNFISHDRFDNFILNQKCINGIRPHPFTHMTLDYNDVEHDITYNGNVHIPDESC
jgi:hypothetical protein